MFSAMFRVAVFSLAMILLTGLLYPLAVTGIAQAMFPEQANGSLIASGPEQVIGSRLVAQKFSSPRYFHPRPSAVDYAADNSGASNLGVTNKFLRAMLTSRVNSQRQLNGEDGVPADMVMASGSGLDPHITPEAANYQVGRIAKARGLPVEAVRALVDRMTEGRTLGILGMPRVNVLMINLELDRMLHE